MKKITIFIAILGFLFSCSKYESQFTEDSDLAIFHTHEFAYIYKDEIFFANRYFKNTKKISAPPGDKRDIEINRSRDKIAYLDANSIPIIIDTLGNVLAMLNQYQNTNDIQWNYEGNSLLILYNNRLHQWGDSMPLPALFQFPTGATDTLIYKFAINHKNTVISAYHFYDPPAFLPYKSGYYVSNLAGVNDSFLDQDDLTYNYNFLDIYPMRQIATDSSSYFEIIYSFSNYPSLNLSNIIYDFNIGVFASYPSSDFETTCYHRRTPLNQENTTYLLYATALDIYFYETQMQGIYALNFPTTNGDCIEVQWFDE